MKQDNARVGERIRRFRLAKGLSLEELAEDLSLNRDSVYRWERGESLPRSTRRLALAKALGVEFQSIFVEFSERLAVADELSVDHMLRVLTDGNADANRRDAMAKALRRKLSTQEEAAVELAALKQNLRDAHDSFARKLLAVEYEDEIPRKTDGV